MKAWNGMITNYADIETIRTKGTVTVWVETRTDRDGWLYEVTVKGYEYEGKRYTIETDRDGWPIAWEHK
jgi:hypothetical protein